MKVPHAQLYTAVSVHVIDTIHSLDMYGYTHSKSMDQPGNVADPARGQLHRENEYFPVRIRA